jgi:hypothetical protein
MKNIIVKPSFTHGKGVFANREFKKDEVILDIDDTHIAKDESQLTQYQKENVCDWLPDKIVLMQSPERYINHSCNPNSYIKTISGIRKVLAMGHIKRGEEITYDYSINGDNDGTFKCHCGSGNCRGTYQGDFFKLPRKLQLKYLPYLETWFIQKHKHKIAKLKSANSVKINS